jgi:carbonic anhydrase
VNWFVQAKPISLFPEQIAAFWENLEKYPGNARDLQPLNGRTINYVVDP